MVVDFIGISGDNYAVICTLMLFVV